jgi:hypothetical protein
VPVLDLIHANAPFRSASNMPAAVDLALCVASCHGHGICMDWPAEPQFPAFCVCETEWDGLHCDTRKPNPFRIREEATKYLEWKATYGVACGKSGGAVSCSDCGATAAMCGIGGDCVWQVSECRLPSALLIGSHRPFFTQCQCACIARSAQSSAVAAFTFYPRMSWTRMNCARPLRLGPRRLHLTWFSRVHAEWRLP